MKRFLNFIAPGCALLAVIAILDGCSVTSSMSTSAVPQRSQTTANVRQGRDAVKRPDGPETVLTNFGNNGRYCSDEEKNGDLPLGGLLANKKGVLYGTTSGEVEDCGNAGSFYKMVPSGSGGYTRTALYYFCSLAPTCTPANDGQHPQGELIARKGVLYGTTAYGGDYGDGTVYKLSHTGSAWGEKVLHSFYRFSDGAHPQSGLVMDSSGALYGTTNIGNGSYRGGALFKLTPSAGGWSETILHVFSGYPYDGSGPVGRLLYVKTNGGTLYGTTQYGGSFYTCNGGFSCGTVFELNLSTKAYKVIYNFSGNDGAQPEAGLIADKKGDLYGTTYYGGTGYCTYTGVGCGTVFKLSPSGSTYKEVFVYSFKGTPDGEKPHAPLLLENGALYGTTAFGGDTSPPNYCENGFTCGTVFKFTGSGGSYTESILYTFHNTSSITDGWFPKAPVIALNGKLYGTTPSGGAYGYPCCDGGTVFSLQP